MQGDQSAVQSWDFQSVSLVKLLSWNQTGGCRDVWIHSIGPIVLSLKAQRMLCRKGKKCPTPSYRLVGTTSMRDWISTAKSHVPHSSVLQGEERGAKSWNIQSMRPLEAIVWDWDERLSCLLQAGLVSSPNGRLFGSVPLSLGVLPG